MRMAKDPIAGRWPELARIMIARLTVLSGVFFGLVAVVPADAISFYAMVALAFVVNIPYALWLRDERKTAQSAPLQFLVDAVVVTGLVHFSGGIDSELCLLYPLVILSAGIVGGGRIAVKLTLLCIVLYAWIILLEMNGILAYFGPPPSPYADTWAVLQKLMIRIFVFAFFSAASNFLAERCGFQAAKIRRYRQWIEAVFQRVPVGLFAVDAAGRIALANRAGAEMLGADPDGLAGTRLAAFLADPAANPWPPDSGKTITLKRADGACFPALVEIARAELPEAPPSRGQPYPGQAPGTIVALRDLSAEIRAKQTEQEASRLRTVLRLTGEMAHALRNPLTAIRGAAESLAAVLAKPQSGAGLDESDRQLLATLQKLILDETERLDAKMEEFMTYAAADPDRLLQGAAGKFVGPPASTESR